MGKYGSLIVGLSGICISFLFIVSLPMDPVLENIILQMFTTFFGILLGIGMERMINGKE